MDPISDLNSGDTSQQDSTSSEQANSTAAPITAPDEKEIDPRRAALVKQWIETVKSDKKHWKDIFARMDKCITLAEQGADDVWTKEDKNYVVPILTRHINQSVATLYAKDPQAQAKRTHRLMNTVWDGTLASLDQARQAAQAFQQQQMAVAQSAPPIGHNGGPPMQGPPQLDPNVQAILADAERVRAYNVLIDRLAKTLELLWNHFMQDQQAGYKQLFKALVRRTKVCSVGYVKLGYQRVLEKRPEITAQINDITGKIAATQAILAELDEGDLDTESAKLEQLRLNLQDLQDQETMVVREGPVFDFPASDEIIIDKRCRHLKTLTGAWHYAHEFDMTADEIQETYNIDIEGSGAGYTEPARPAEDGSGEKDSVRNTYKVWEIHDKKNQQVLTVCDGYKDFFKEPATPDVWLNRFWNLFPLVFNEVESKKKIFPLSDVWLARHAAAEYNRSRQAMREHRIQNRPKYVGPAGVLLNEDLNKLENAESGAFLPLQGLQPGQDAEKVLQPMKQHPIDSALYDTNPIYEDILRTVGATEANLGPPNGNVTATAEGIAASSRSVSASDNIDDLDDMLSALAQATGEMMLQELSKETVVEIVGPGAVWPDMEATRNEISKDVLLDIRAGSSGRPNRAAELADLKGVLPFVLQMPGINPIPWAKKLTDLSNIDAEDAVVEGLPSVVAVNAQMSSLDQAATGGVAPPGGGAAPEAGVNSPMAQGPQGANPIPSPSIAPGQPQNLNPQPIPVG